MKPWVKIALENIEDTLYDVATDIQKTMAAPAINEWRGLSNHVLRRRGANLYNEGFIPGFEETKAKNFLLLPTRDSYDEQVEAGLVPGYRQDTSERERRQDAGKAKKVLKSVAKLGNDRVPYEQGLQMPLMFPAGTPENDKYVRSNADQAWNLIDSSTRGETGTETFE